MKVASAPEPARGRGGGKVSVRLDAASLKRIDALVAIGPLRDRTSATEWLIHKGIKRFALVWRLSPRYRSSYAV